MAYVFINYRTGDGEKTATTFDEVLRNRFGDNASYRASRSIPPGSLFDADLLRSVRRSSVLLSLIGPDWVGHPGLRGAEDWVTQEILEAFACDIPVVPVLLGRRTERPKKSGLPASLSRLADCQTLRYDDQNAPYDLLRIGDALAGLVPELAAGDRKESAEDPARDTTTNNVRDTRSGNIVQAGTVEGDAGTVIRNSTGAVNTGPGAQYNHSSHITGDGVTNVNGDVRGGVRGGYRGERRDKETER
ncbi:toll/interleukin-1 receptor domain-containing protein [Streptomyces tsukubensis]|uniref:Uncharacterized protein n=1 Tax=Streptomyces tsukubensis TaxID=83656 RepID=A0A1V4AEF8_9ACTN|nr:TIR domain-containing protein [Streptomyces tsukubensis]OON82410.1 hypothetical protein B1H18_03260 [Streptomyces tsukubensis]QFR92571.1 TIR domain-containing protein [Streptomyces tsukubensis]